MHRVPRSRGVSERPEHLHDEDRLARVLECAAHLASQGVEENLVRSKDLCAHAVGVNLEALVAVQALDEVLNRRNELRRQGIQADLNSNVHGVTVTSRSN